MFSYVSHRATNGQIGHSGQHPSVALKRVLPKVLPKMLPSENALTCDDALIFPKTVVQLSRVCVRE